MDFWGNGTVFVDPKVGNLDPRDIAPYLASGFVVNPDNYQQVTLAAQLPVGWGVDIARRIVGQGEQQMDSGPPYVRSILHERPDGLIDVYSPEGVYQVTSTLDSGDGLAGLIVRAVIAYGVGAAGSEVFAAAQAGTLTGQVSPASTGASNVNYFSDPMYGGVDPAVVNYDVPSLDVGGADAWDFDLYSQAPTIPEYAIPEVTVSSPMPVSTGGSWVTQIRDLTGGIREIGAAVLTGAQLVSAFKGQVNAPTVVASPTNGLVNGARPGVGVVTSTGNGGAVINNGDGTYTVINPDGSRVTRSYGGTTGSTLFPTTAAGGLDTNKLLLYGALAVGAAMLLQRSGARR